MNWFPLPKTYMSQLNVLKVTLNPNKTKYHLVQFTFGNKMSAFYSVCKFVICVVEEETRKYLISRYK